MREQGRAKARGASGQASGLGGPLSLRIPACREGNAREGLASCLVLVLCVCARCSGHPKPLVSRAVICLLLHRVLSFRLSVAERYIGPLLFIATCRHHRRLYIGIALGFMSPTAPRAVATRTMQAALSTHGTCGHKSFYRAGVSPQSTALMLKI